MDPLTTHVLDVSKGTPAHNLKITLSKQHGLAWNVLKTGYTDPNGRLKNLVSAEQFTVGIYKMKFEIQEYYQHLHMTSFYPYAEIVFEVTNPGEHYHVPLILSPYGYSTYRGS